VDTRELLAAVAELAVERVAPAPRLPGRVARAGEVPARGDLHDALEPRHPDGDVRVALIASAEVPVRRVAPAVDLALGERAGVVLAGDHLARGQREAEDVHRRRRVVVRAAAELALRAAP